MKEKTVTPKKKQRMERISKAKEMRKKGMAYTTIAKKFDVSIGTAWMWAKDGKDLRRKDSKKRKK